MVVLGNPFEFPTVAPVAVTLLWVTGIAVLLAWAFVVVAAMLPRFSLVIRGFLAASSLAVLVQSSFIRWELGPLDGRSKVWSQFSAQSRVDLVVWFAILAAVIGAVVRTRTPKVATWVSAAALGVGCIQLTGSVMARATREDAPRSTATETEALSFHPSHNVVVIVVDTFQSDAFDEIRRRFPGEVEFLSGFEFFPDTVGGYPTTRFAIPSLMNGILYTNDIPFTLENQMAMSKESLATAYKARHFRVVGDFGFAPFAGMGGHNIVPATLRDTRYAGLDVNDLRALDAGLYRSLPLFMKERIYDNGKWYLTSKVLARTSIPYPMNEDLEFSKSFVDGARVFSRKEGEFKFFHLRGVHSPLIVNERYEYVPRLAETREAYINQARGALLLLRRMFDKLRELNVLDTAEIVILGDHGHHNLPPADMTGDPSETSIPSHMIGQARPLLLYKKRQPTSTGITVNPVAMHTAWVPCLLGVGVRERCGDFEASMRGEAVVRAHFRYEWTHDSWFADHAPTMTRYEVRGDARRYSSWTNTGVTYPP